MGIKCWWKQKIVTYKEANNNGLTEWPTLG